MIKENFIKLFENSFKENWDKPALYDYLTGIEKSYGEMATKIARLHALYEKLKIRPGDKIALSGKNSSSWAIVFMATVTYGAVIVPVLEEFNHNDITHVLNHSDSLLLFCDVSIYKKLNLRDIPNIKGIISLEDMTVLEQRQGGELKRVVASVNALMRRKYPNGFSAQNIKYIDRDNSELAMISYTSGTTSLTKGVMLSANNLAGNTMFGINNYAKLGVKLTSSLCVLPLAHTYATAFNLLVQLVAGAKITFLGKIPSPNIVIEACRKVKPTLLFFVPLVMEKIYKIKIVPLLENKYFAFALRLPIIGKMLYRMIGRKMYKAFGGKTEDIIVGGAAFNPEIEAFFHKTGLPFLVGYGMTECAPLISYIHHSEFVPTSVGKVLPGIMEVRISKEHENDEIGEIQVRGENVMIGYYKDEEATRNTFTEDGWLKTGDLGMIDKEGNIYIKGRSKTMLLGPSGENIYPEAIESKLGNMPLVAECIVVQNGTRLEAWVYPDYDTAEQIHLDPDKIPTIMEDNLKTLNSMLAKFERISAIKIAPEPFPKTPKRTIKRYMAVPPANEKESA
ncbi:MAG TPA: AMP-binding protein [Candidatus Avirikenella pullistercoris]|nr:AMP-binding protein [Candidatus Avirikenella pullistercoris]